MGISVKLRHTLTAAAAGLALAGASFLLSPASAVSIAGIDVAATCSGTSCSGATPVSLTVTGAGSLAISVPAPTSPATAVDLGSVAAGSALTTTPNSLGQVTVTDTRTGILNNNWVVAATSSDLILSGKTAVTAGVNEKIPAASVGYSAGSFTKTVEPAVGGATPVAVAAASLVASVPVVTTVSLGANTISWSPNLVVTVLPTTVAGTYTGTVTHSAL
jgi:hypothetical protein